VAFVPRGPALAPARQQRDAVCSHQDPRQDHSREPQDQAKPNHARRQGTGACCDAAHPRCPARGRRQAREQVQPSSTRFMPGKRTRWRAVSRWSSKNTTR